MFSDLTCIRLMLCTILMFSLPTNTHAFKTFNTETEENYYVEFKGLVTERNEEGLFDAVITVYSKNAGVFTTVATNHDGKCNFKLPFNKIFTIEFSKKGYVSKKISINTTVPYMHKGNLKFAYTVSLFEEILEIDVSALKAPLAKIVFNGARGHFDYDYRYTMAINKDIEKRYQDYYLLASREDK